MKKFSEVFENHKEEVAKCLESGITLWLMCKGTFVTITGHLACPDEYCEGCDSSFEYDCSYDGEMFDGGFFDFKERDYESNILQLIDDLIEFVIGESDYKATGFQSGEGDD